jgi:hypothetical protein
VIRGLFARFRCIAVDLLGFGLSEKPRHFDYRPAEYAARLRRLVDHLKLAGYAHAQAWVTNERLLVGACASSLPFEFTIDDSLSYS